MKTSKTLALLFALTMIFSIVLPSLSKAASVKYFKDVNPANPYHYIIHKMAEDGVVSGYEDSTFKPDQTINRKQAAALVNRVVKLPVSETFKAPKDITNKNPYYTDIKKFIEAGLFELDRKGNVNPNAALTRGEMAKILTVAFGLDTSGKNPLKGVSSKAKPYVTALYNAGVTTGFADGTFKENQSLTRSHYAVFMYRAMNLTEEGVPNEEAQMQIDYKSTYVGGKGYDSVPLPAKFKGKTTREVNDVKDAEYDKYKASMPRGSYKIKFSLEDAAKYYNRLNQISEVTGVSIEDIAKYIDEAAKTGNNINFIGENGKKYFVMFGYKFSITYVGEDHTK